MNKLLAGMAALCALSGEVRAADAPADCAGVTDIKSKSRTLGAMSTLMVNLLVLEKQGESNFKPAYAAPTSDCVFERFDAGGSHVTAITSPLVKSEGMTLLHRFVTDGAEPREIIVVFDGMTSLVAEKTVFFVIENRAGNISYYEMYRDQPTYAVLKPLVTSILGGNATALATVRWPPGAKEPVIDAVDSKRLK